VNVYGVTVQGSEGRAGMVALMLREGEAFDAASFKAHVDASLPPYARPLFVRVVREMPETGTLKLQKRGMQEDGFDPSRTEDALFVCHPHTRAYVPLTPAVHAELASGRLRL
jgi:acyl-CoA synthetase (AMP-forming)/AMP-acid ligase II